MAAIQQISNGSFSHVLEFLEESLGRSFDARDAASFIEMDLDFFSMRWTDSLDFNFSHPSAGGGAASPTTINADQIIFNGRLLPLHLVNSGPIASPDSVLLSISQSKSSPCQSESAFSAYSADSSMNTVGNWGNKQSGKSPAKILRKYLYFLVPLYKKVKKLKRRSCRRRGNIGLASVDRPRPASRVFDEEAASSIRDAVLHCKKSNGDSLAGENSG